MFCFFKFTHDFGKAQHVTTENTQEGALPSNPKRSITHVLLGDGTFVLEWKKRLKVLGRTSVWRQVSDAKLLKNSRNLAKLNDGHTTKQI